MSKRIIRVARNCSNKAGRKIFNNGNLAVAALMDAIEKENDFAMIAYLAYLGDPTINMEKTGFEEWLTLDKLNQLMGALDIFQEMTEFQEKLENMERVSIKKEFMEKYDLNSESGCKELLEKAQKKETLLRCPRCGGNMTYFTPSMEGGRIFICPECRADEEYRAKTGSRLPYTEWMLIQCAKEYVSDCA